MNWKCEVCDTYNEAGSKHCFVCGQKRSSESIRAEAAELRKDRLSRWSSKLSEENLKYLKWCFAGSILLALAVIVISVVLRLLNHQGDDTIAGAVYLAKRSWNRITVDAVKDFPVITRRLLDGIGGDSVHNLKRIGAYAQANIEETLIPLKEIITVRLPDRFSDIKAFGEVFFEKAAQVAGAVVSNIAAVYQKIIHHISG